MQPCFAADFCEVCNKMAIDIQEKWERIYYYEQFIVKDIHFSGGYQGWLFSDNSIALAKDARKFIPFLDLQDAVNKGKLSRSEKVHFNAHERFANYAK